MSDNNK